jgi:hypothetical protein
MEPGCIGKSNTNNLPAPTDLTENPYRYYLLPHDAIPRYGTTHDDSSRVGGWKIQRFGLCSVEHPILIIHDN